MTKYNKLLKLFWDIFGNVVNSETGTKFEAPKDSKSLIKNNLPEGCYE